ncbi:MsnO8 family LLM class oxidoreductase [Streptomyces griseoviridis]|uniref:Luciferase family oxidoreductase group 1 n=3 Tax=Streptomyces TaxID=1883 RepID=A0ABT9LM41_STRGD|nr:MULTISPECIES: MsnO8 family LLM class oxidoreductase [Streptomyces]MDP9684586.1 luciferase family oxidoreductase group 1 [Streptomyces griseoviridis]GGS64274.1 alkane monooxygenase [Streptomyces niveoruber]GGT20654.1 alkane monooxygenase [Streptomyces griseoviridis]GGU61596.1 alkane monooxygenase [Streptomyces daghestanicus]GHI30459.1 alkane monooxygenase [Streptomyces daghestanicus]
MKLSLVELATVAPGTDKPQALNDVLDAARQAEDLGYHRIWYAEHHDTAGFAAQAPEILIALAARATSRIRVGSGAVLLNHYSPYKVAETFLQLEALAPGRIDLGLGRATAGPLVDLALRRDRHTPPADDYNQQIEEVLAHLGLHPDHGSAFARLDPPAGIPTRPQVWILGSSGTSAQTAAELGLGYAFAGFINPDAAPRALLRHGAYAHAVTGPADRRALLAVSAVVADTDAEARRLSWTRTALLARTIRTGTSTPVPTVEEAAAELSDAEKNAPTVITDGRWPRQIAGSPATVRDQIEQMTKATGVDEVMIQDIVADPEARAHSRTLLAQALGISPGA